MELENRVITKDYRDGFVSYLRQQHDGRYTINSGVWTDSGWDRCYIIESTNDTGALDIFKQFLNIFYRSDIDEIDKQDLYSDLDIYFIDDEYPGYYYDDPDCY